MTRAAITVTLVLGLAGCRPPAPPVAETRMDQAPPAKSALAQPATPAVEPTAVPALVAIARVATSGVVPPGVVASSTTCEARCGDVHDCAVHERIYTPAAAAAIELGCVRACLSTPERATLFGCRAPDAIGPGSCAPFLACVQAAWPPDSEIGSALEPPPPSVRSDPCTRVCDAFARCWDPTTTSEQIELCAEQCRQALDVTQEHEFGRCADLSECTDIMTCVAETPGA